MLEIQSMASRRKLPWTWWPPETKTMGAIAQNKSPEAKTMGANEAPMEMGFPKPFVVPLKKTKKYQVIFPRQNVVMLTTKLITFWPIA